MEPNNETITNTVISFSLVIALGFAFLSQWSRPLFLEDSAGGYDGRLFGLIGTWQKSSLNPQSYSFPLWLLFTLYFYKHPKKIQPIVQNSVCVVDYLMTSTAGLFSLIAIDCKSEHPISYGWSCQVMCCKFRLLAMAPSMSVLTQNTVLCFHIRISLQWLVALLKVGCWFPSSSAAWW